MKSLLLMLLLLPGLASAKTEKNALDVMEKFVRYYNANQTDSICTLFPERTERPGKECFWRWAEGQGHSSRDEYGKISIEITTAQLIAGSSLRSRNNSRLR